MVGREMDKPATTSGDIFKGVPLYSYLPLLYSLSHEDFLASQNQQL